MKKYISLGALGATIFWAIVFIIHLAITDEGWQWFYDLEYSPVFVALIVISHSTILGFMLRNKK